MFTLRDVERITGLRPSLASSLLHKAAKRGLVTLIKRGVFVLVPPEMGSATGYAGDSYLVARRLAGDAPSFISHASAMEIHLVLFSKMTPTLTFFVRSKPSETTSTPVVAR
jgi:predicted transcriptional regulator of viral defense system